MPSTVFDPTAGSGGGGGGSGTLNTDDYFCAYWEEKASYGLKKKTVGNGH